MQLNANGRAVTTAVNIALGQDPVFRKQAVYASLLADGVLECQIQDHRDPALCTIATPYGPSYQIYKWRCSARLRDCVVFGVDPAILKYPKVAEAVSAVASKPCTFLPSQQEIDAQLAESAKYGPLKGKPTLIELQEYAHARALLECDAPSARTLLLYWSAFSTTGTSHKVYSGTTSFGK